MTRGLEKKGTVDFLVVEHHSTFGFVSSVLVSRRARRTYNFSRYARPTQAGAVSTGGSTTLELMSPSFRSYGADPTVTQTLFGSLRQTGVMHSGV